MRPSIFVENESVLLVGEGNFSFSVALCQLNLKIKLTATCYETNVSHETGKKNIEYLKKHGVRVLLGVDATILIEDPILKNEFFDKIIFNFPHVGGKMRIEKNRELLKQFFIGIEKLNNRNLVVLITLCNGQGGTFMDEPRRHWNDTWKVTEMAAHGNFILNTVEPFLWSYFPSYVVTGYRSLQKEFHTTNALTHFFKRSYLPNFQNISPKNKVDISTCNTDKFLRSHIFHKTNEVSNINIWCMCPPTFVFDITMCVARDFDPLKFYTTLYNHAGYIVDEINFIGSYTSPFKEKVTKTYRITYKSHVIPLYRERVIQIHQNLIPNILEQNLNVLIPR